MGLVGAGGVSQSFLSRMPSLHAQLGPIKGVSFAAARRLVMTLRAGRAVPNYSALELCPLIWIYVPDNAVDATLRDLAEQTAMHHTMIVICGTQRDSTTFDVLRHRGARVATLNTVDDTWQTAFVAEGHPDTMRAVRKVLAAERRKLIELRPGSKHRFLTAMHLMSDLLWPFTATAMACLQSAGVESSTAADLVDATATRALKSFARSGAKPLAAKSRQRLVYALSHQVELLRATAPREAELYANSLQLALEYGERPHRKAAAHAANRRP